LGLRRGCRPKRRIRGVMEQVRRCSSKGLAGRIVVVEGRSGNPQGTTPMAQQVPAVNLLMKWKSGRQIGLQIDLFSRNGVVEFQILGVQEIASVAGEAGEIFERLTGCAVQRITY
jgi:hypothetical protein